MSFESALETFYVEAQEHLELMDNNLLQMDDGEINNEILNDIFRSAHTIKGSAGIFALSHIVEFTHVVENVLDRARDGLVVIEKPLIDILFRCRDHMEKIVSLTVEEFNADQLTQSNGAILLAELMPWSDEQTKDNAINDNDEAVQSHTDIECDLGIGHWHISLRLSDDCLKNGMDPVSFIRFLATLGTIKHIECIHNKLPTLSIIDPEELYFAYEISLDSEAEQESIENTFMFVQDGSQITILPPTAPESSLWTLIDSLPEEESELVDIFFRCGSLKAGATRSEKTTTNTTENHTILAVQEKTTPPVEEATTTSTKPASASKQIRIDSDRLDYLINLIGELVINQQRIDILSNRTGNSELLEAVDDFEDFTEQIRDAALNLRMVPIGGTFQRFKRIVRDTAQELGKEINLTIEGAETELDRLMVEKIGDPLTHIVRNAIDHGIESVDERIAAGKSAKGQLTLKAYHEGGHIVIAISDDGKGIDKSRVREKAIEKGIITEHVELSDHELFHLIFHPGFSTASAVTNLSGRGVGMDVVKRNVESLQGSIEIFSDQGQGSEFRISLPLTLAIIDGFHVESCGTHFIIPQATIIECIDLHSHLDIQERNCIKLRGEMIPFVKMADVFNLTKPVKITPLNLNGNATEQIKPSSQELVIVQFGGDLAGIAVDKLNGEVQTVIKPLGPIFKPLKGIGGSSLLGNGDIAFILDIPQLIELAIGRDGLSHNTLLTKE
ncbi:chemotaxis protein CheA [Thalassotalea sp. 1_MG-2023]|uniref:chemotaxis protein CheA n=1 Tax=Thalassotalea sp. 1_MG-2023 TaxID=3062680 RepID=UPI0026E28E1F|nr:chemotaxis protein CheA [Thalassotalea sp. 1_MG-2023]MDO6427396.1 chemotaxis protein CheA [Thalassotalea sp. 1_MG-2023]